MQYSPSAGFGIRASLESLVFGNRVHQTPEPQTETLRTQRIACVSRYVYVSVCVYLYTYIYIYMKIYRT